jgi:hypothetical protein
MLAGSLPLFQPAGQLLFSVGSGIATVPAAETSMVIAPSWPAVQSVGVVAYS